MGINSNKYLNVTVMVMSAIFVYRPGINPVQNADMPHIL